MQQAAGPASHRRWVWRPRRVCDIRNRSLPVTVRLAQQLPRFLPAVEAVGARRRRPIGQYRECLFTWRTETSANPDLRVPFVMRLFEPPPVTDDRPFAAERAHPRQPRERDLGHPAVVLSSDSDSAIKRINGWREGPPLNVPCQSSVCWPGLHPPGKSVSNKKRILRFRSTRRALVTTLAGNLRLHGS